MTTRFPHHHKLLAISSVTTGSTWLHKRVVQSQTQGETYARRVPDLGVEVLQVKGRQGRVKLTSGQQETRAAVSRTLAADHGLKLIGEVGDWAADGSRWATTTTVEGATPPASVSPRAVKGGRRRPEPPDPTKPTALAVELMAEGTLSPADWDEYARLRITRHRYRSRLSIVAPTWLTRSTKTIDDFLKPLADPMTRDSARSSYASLVGSGSRPFFRVPSVLQRGAIPGRLSPVTSQDEENTVASGEPILLAHSFEPNPLTVYAFAADYSVGAEGGDKTGVALVHFELAAGPAALPTFVLDFSFRVAAAPGGRIDYEPIRQLVRDLRDKGFRIGKVGFDQYQSNDSYVMLEKEGFDCEIVKHADSIAGCNLLQSFISAGQFVYGACDKVFIGEATELQVKPSGRIDHRKGDGFYNSKDVWDATVNATWMAQQLSRGEYGEFLMRGQIPTYDPKDAFAPLGLTAEERLLSEGERQARQLPHNGHALMAFVYCRYGAEKDADAVAIALGAVDRKSGHCRLMSAPAGRWTPAQLADRLLALERAWRGKGFYRLGEQSLEIFIPDSQAELELTLAELAEDLSVLRSAAPFAPDVAIKAAQAAAGAGRLSVPARIEPGLEGHQLDAAINQLVNYPHTPSIYLALAMEGLLREAEGADFSEPTDLSRVFRM
jgi:hypothetical protein